MPVNKNAMTRYKILDKLLSNRYHNYTMDEIVAEINRELLDLGLKSVTRRCIEKDIAYLKGDHSEFMADIESYPIDCYNGKKIVRKKGIRYADPSFSIFKKEMSNDESYLIYQTLSLLEQFEGLPHLEDLRRLKIGLVKDSSRKIVSFSRNYLDNTQIFGDLFRAISHKQVIMLRYHTFNAPDNISSILFHPYLLKEYNRRWFLFGIADEDHAVLNFALDRINAVEALPSQKYIEYAGQLDEWFDDIIGVTKYADKKPEKILFWVNDHSKDYLLTKPIHDSQVYYKHDEEFRQKYPDLSRGAFFSINCIENYELIRELMSYGTDLIVLSPDEIKGKILKQIQDMESKYLDLRT